MSGVDQGGRGSGTVWGRRTYGPAAEKISGEESLAEVFDWFEKGQKKSGVSKRKWRRRDHYVKTRPRW